MDNEYDSEMYYNSTEDEQETINLLISTYKLVQNSEDLSPINHMQIEQFLMFMESNLGENENDYQIDFEIQLMKEPWYQLLNEFENVSDKRKWNYAADNLILSAPDQEVELDIKSNYELARKEHDFKLTLTESESSPKEINIILNSCNNFTTGLDEQRANHAKQFKKGVYKDCQSYLAKIHYPNNANTEKQVLGKTENTTSRRQPFKPPIREKAKKNDADVIMDTPLMEFAKNEGLDYLLVEAIEHEILDKQPMVSWSDIAGLEDVKKIINETIIFPNLRPDIFTGLRKPAKGILLFGPPGTGKTMIGRAIAGQLNSTFFSISSSSLVSKWVGESEKLIKTLFKMAAFMQPSVIFVDEIDSLLSVRGDSEADVVRRIKTEFFVQIDGAKTCEDDRILIIGTTNRPEQLDEAARRRFVKRLYIPLPDKKARLDLVMAVLAKEKRLNVKVDIEENSLDKIVILSKGYSCADIVNMMKEAAMGPVRDLMTMDGKQNCSDWNIEDIRPLQIGDLESSLARVKSSVSASEIGRYRDWNNQFGLFEIIEE